jgi:hypothetical protein
MAEQTDNTDFIGPFGIISLTILQIIMFIIFLTGIIPPYNLISLYFDFKEIIPIS